jgi:glycosyltransferase involved in cell wall biosynthesis
MQPVHVMHIIDGLRVGGAETLLCNLVRGLPRERFRITVGYCTPGPLIKDLQAQNVSLIQFPRLAMIDPLLVWRMWRAIKHDPPLIVHTHLFKSDMHGRPAARLAKVPVVVSAIQNCNDWARNPLLGRMYGQTTWLADRLIAASEEVRQFTIQMMGVPAQRIVTIPNAVPVQRFQGQHEAGKRLRIELGIDLQSPLVGIVARLMPQKDHATFLDAGAALMRSLPQARFLIVGDGPLRMELEAQARALGIAESVLFAGLRSDIPAVMAALDVLVFSSRWEGLPVAMLEGMAAGVPVVATAVDGIPGVINDAQNGLLVPPQQPQALASALLRVLQDRMLAEQIGSAGARHVEQHYSIQAAIRQTIALYDALLQQSGNFHLSSEPS